MARQRRLVIPYTAHHVLHRGHNRGPVFLSERDFRYYLENLRDLKAKFNCRVYAYCLMLNHVHLLVDPGLDPTNISQLMKHLAWRQARHSARNRGRGTPLWENRFRSSPVAADHLLPVVRYIEFNPVRAYLAQQPQQYEWSSCRQRLGQEIAWIDLDGGAIGLNCAPAKQGRHYAEYLASPIPLAEWQRIRQAIQSGGVTGDADFACHLEQQPGVRLKSRPRGRPRRAATIPESLVSDFLSVPIYSG